MNKNNLIAGFFRYHREKLNYSQTGLIDDSSPVSVSSLCDFENGKRILTESQLFYLYNLIGFNYNEIINCSSFNSQYEIILDEIYNGNINNAENLYFSAVNQGVYNTLSTIDFAFLSYVITIITRKELTNHTSIILSCKNLLSSDQIAILKICDGKLAKDDGKFDAAISCLKDVHSITYNNNIRAWAYYQLGVVYIQTGNYIEALSSTLEARSIYAETLNIKRLIHVNLNLGIMYMDTNSNGHAEESYLLALNAAKQLKDSKKVVTKCFNSICWLYFKTNQYDKVRELIDDKPEDLIENRNTYFVLAWANYKLGNVDECVRYCVEGKKRFPDHEYACTVYQYIENAVKGKKTGQTPLLRKAITMKDYEHNKEIDELFTLELIDIYERRKNYENAYKYARKLLNR